MLPDSELPGDLERNLRVEALPGPDVAERPVLDEVGPAEGVQIGQSSGRMVGEVRSRASVGFGTGLGFTYLSLGFMVRWSELVELMLGFRDRLPLSATGTSRTLTSCPGSIGHRVVEGSAEL
jgi:hypothetical protein